MSMHCAAIILAVLAGTGGAAGCKKGPPYQPKEQLRPAMEDGTPVESIKGIEFTMSLADTTNKHQCMSVLVDRAFALTAGHCLRDDQLQVVPVVSRQIRYGHVNLKHKSMRSLPIRKFYCNDALDLGLVEFSRQLKNITPVSAHTHKDVVNVRGLGWGAIRRTNKGLVFPQNLFALRLQLTMTNYPLGEARSKRGGPCERDSGAPLLSGNKLVAVLTNGHGCDGHPGNVSVFVSALAAERWARKVIQATRHQRKAFFCKDLQKS
jgi:hypothetical protein